MLFLFNYLCFYFQAGLRESWTNDMTAVLSDQNFGSNTTQVEAALKKHEAIAAEIETRVRNKLFHF